MPTRRYPRYPAEKWQAWIEEQASGGLSQRVFSAHKGLAKSSFHLWKRRLELTPGAAAPSSQPATDVSSLFAPLMASNEAPEHEAGG